MVSLIFYFFAFNITEDQLVLTTIGILIILKSPKNIFASTLFISFKKKKKIIKMLPPEISPSISTTKYKANAFL